MVIGTLAYWHISTLKFNFGNTDAVIVQHDAEVAGGSAFERIGNQFAVFADGARIYGEELSATARELDFEGCRQVVVTCKGNGNFIYLGSVLQGKGNIISLISLPCGIDFFVEHVFGILWVGAGTHTLCWFLGFNGFGTGLVVFYGQRSVQADVFGASKELKEFVDKVNAPVCDTLMGKGAYDGTSDNYTGMLGMHGTKTSNLGVSECDLLIAIGTRFSDRVLGNPKKFADQAKILQFDVDAAEINKNIRVTSSVIGDVKEILTRINKKLTQLDHNSWVEHVLAYAKTFPLTYHKEGLSGPFVIQKIYEMTKGNAIMVTEVGQHQMWAAQYYKYSKPRTLLTSGGLGTMGYGLGAAIGAQTANPDRTVVNIAGDGCFRMNMNEIATASREKLPLIEVIINNHVLGMVRQWQTLFYEKHYSATVLDDGVDYVKLSEAMGATARRVKTQEEFEKAFADALKSKTPFVIDCIIDSDDKVWPMVAPGKPINESFDEEDYNATQGGN